MNTLEPWIIEEIRKREEEQRRIREQPQIEITDEEPPDEEPRPDDQDEPRTGVSIYPLFGEGNHKRR